MSYESNLEDTRPQAPVRVPENDTMMVPGQVYRGDEAPPERAGCGMTALIIGGLMLLSLMIVGLATAAGWVTGQREGQTFATATRASAIAEQISRIAGDVESGNSALVARRLQFLAEVTPGLPEYASLSATGTALALSLMPTATPTPTQTPQATATLAVPTQEAAPIATQTGGGFDLPALLAEAENAVNTAQWDDAIELLDAVSGIDPNFETARVRQLLLQALNSYAAQLYNSYAPGSPGRLAEAIVLTDRAEQIGALADGLAFERNAAQLYLDARRAIGLDPFTAIRAFERLYNQGGQGRYFQEAQQELFNQYVALGDTQTAIFDHCPAAQYYQTALTYLSSGGVSAKLSSANTLCASATPIPLPGTVIAPQNLTPIAPLGVPGT